MPDRRLIPEVFPDDTFLIFVALGINIIVTLLGLCPNVDGQAVYYLFMVIAAIIFLLLLLGKYSFLCCCIRNIRPCCADKCIEKGWLSGTKGKWCYCLGSFCSTSMLYDATVCIMVLFYLIGGKLGPDGVY